MMAALVLTRLNLMSVCTGGHVGTTLGLSAGRTIEALRSLSEFGRLSRAGLITCDDPDAEITDRVISVSDNVFYGITSGRSRSAGGWPVQTEEELCTYLARLTVTLRQKNEALRYDRHSFERSAMRLNRKVGSLLDGLKETLQNNPKWKLSKLLKAHPLQRTELLIFLALLGKELGHVEADDYLFRGISLVRAASRTETELHINLYLLGAKETLVRHELIRPCGGTDDFLRNDPSDLAHMEFELGPKAIDMLCLGQLKRRGSRGAYEVREARIRLNQLVLSSEVQQALRLAVTHVRERKTLTCRWGLGELIPYGRNVTLLFWGPPGTGKTASAEGLACELGKPILVVNYAEIQSCWVGETEKNIVRAFNEAKRHDAVLFWDEADAIFFDRDSAARNWEVRDVNVLLQELERFDGVCVLATNRQLTLDKALERRITLKVEFARPDRNMRRQIWEKLLPKNMPVTGDVDLDELSKPDLSGGEIKNAVLNAARTALERRGKGPVRMDDFICAIEMETKGRWSEGGGKPIGFIRTA
jgi:AAA+ superfamily predicted ATPase